MSIKKINALKYPQDRVQLALLSITDFQSWFALQDARAMVFMGQDPAFKQWVFWAYTWKVKVVRTWFKVKRIFGNAFSRGLIKSEIC